MKRKPFVLFTYLLALATTLLAQQPATQTNPLVGVNAKTANGVATGYRLTAGAGLTLNVGAGSARCSATSTVEYAGGTLTMANNTTNYVYLDTGSSCAPGSNTSGWTAALIPLAKVTTVTGNITAIDDVRAALQLPGLPVTVNGQAIAPGGSGDVNSGAAAHSMAVNEGAGSAIAGVALGAHQVPVGAASADPSAKTVPDCQDSGGNHLNFTQSTDAFSCGTSGSGGSLPSSAHLVGTNSTPAVVQATAHDVAADLTCSAASGSGTAYTCNTSPTFTPAAGDGVLFQADVANTSSATLSVNSAGAKTIKKQGGGTNLGANDLLASQWTWVVYDGTNWQMQGQLGNAAGGSGTVTSVDGSACNGAGTYQGGSLAAITSSGTVVGCETVNDIGTGTSSYTILTGDRGKIVTEGYTGGAFSMSLPQATSAGGNFPPGWYFDVMNRQSSGTLTVTPTTSTIDGVSSLALSPGNGARIVSNGTNYFSVHATASGLSTNPTSTAANTVAPSTSGVVPLTLKNSGSGDTFDAETNGGTIQFALDSTASVLSLGGAANAGTLVIKGGGNIESGNVTDPLTVHVLDGSTSSIQTMTVRGSDATGGNESGNALLRAGTVNSSSSSPGSVQIISGASTNTGSSASQGVVQMVPTFVSNGTTTSHFAECATSTRLQVTDCPLGSLSPSFVGINLSASNASPVYAVYAGEMIVKTDNTAVVGDQLCMPPAGTGTAGEFHDNGTTACGANLTAGVVLAISSPDDNPGWTLPAGGRVTATSTTPLALIRPQ